MIVLLIPLAAFFSALTIALAALARSMKEGQYYLTPLFLVAMPLVFATMIPGIELNPLTALLPITGPSLLLRSLIQGQYGQARSYFVPVVLPLLLYAALALRWAVAQFRSESVLFRDTDRFEPVAWMRHLVRDRGPVPTAPQALFAFALLVALAYFGSRLIAPSWIGILESQVLFVALPVILLTALLARSPRATLLLRWPRVVDLALAIGLGLAINPLASALRVWVERVMPISDVTQKAASQLLGSIPDNLWIMLLVLSVLPAICEELAFRGFILQGLRNGFRPGSALVLSAFLFGFLHLLQSLMQQFFPAFLLGLVLGLIAMRTGSLVPCIAFHITNNALAVLLPTWGSEPGGVELPGWLFSDPARAVYHGPWVAVSAVATACLVFALCRRRNDPGAARLESA
jgi:sodium transport system permease protein